MKFTQIPSDLFKEMQLNAGILLDDFTPATGTIGNIIGATSGGLNFSDNPTYEDFGADVDNCPKNTKELKKLTERDVKISGTFLTVTAASVKMLIGAADIDATDETHIIPRADLDDADFSDIWWVGDYSDKNGDTNGGFVAIHMMDALSTGGFQIQSGDKAKGQESFEFTAHPSIETPNVVPYEVYVKAGTSESGDYEMSVVSAVGSTTGYTAITVGTSAGASQTYVYQTGTRLRIPNQNAVLNGSAWTSWDGDDEISATTGMDIVVAIIDSESKAVHAGKTVVMAKDE